MGSIAIVALLVLLAAPAQAKAKADLSVTEVNGVPAAAMTGDELPREVTVANGGKAKSKAFKVTARLAPEAGMLVSLVIGASEAGPLAPGRSTTRTWRRFPELGPRDVGVVVCVPPGRRKTTAGRAPQSRSVTAPARLDPGGPGRGDPRPGRGGPIRALCPDGRPPTAEHLPRNGEGNGNATFGDIAADWSSLSQAEQEALWPYSSSPGTAQSAWGPPTAKMARCRRVVH